MSNDFTIKFIEDFNNGETSDLQVDFGVDDKTYLKLHEFIMVRRSTFFCTKIKELRKTQTLGKLKMAIPYPYDNKFESFSKIVKEYCYSGTFVLKDTNGSALSKENILELLFMSLYLNFTDIQTKLIEHIMNTLRHSTVFAYYRGIRFHKLYKDYPTILNPLMKEIVEFISKWTAIFDPSVIVFESVAEFAKLKSLNTVSEEHRVHLFKYVSTNMKNLPEECRITTESDYFSYFNSTHLPAPVVCDQVVDCLNKKTIMDSAGSQLHFLIAALKVAKIKVPYSRPFGVISYLRHFYHDLFAEMKVSFHAVASKGKGRGIIDQTENDVYTKYVQVEWNKKLYIHPYAIAITTNAPITEVLGFHPDLNQYIQIKFKIVKGETLNSKETTIILLDSKYFKFNAMNSVKTEPIVDIKYVNDGFYSGLKLCVESTAAMKNLDIFGFINAK